MLPPLIVVVLIATAERIGQAILALISAAGGIQRQVKKSQQESAGYKLEQCNISNNTTVSPASGE
ncbi:MULTISPECIES: hypothetical protein [unclassified Serratia (in: enterobacteria)]|uniref:hypothetical protein n=1 Tax=unclassified Serratia (in: enterobacteria) TaxID=2647522 RepID=UPI003B42F10C